MQRIDAADLARLATVEFTPPRELTPAQGGVLLTETVLPQHKVAWPIGAAVDGYLELEETDGAVTLVRLPRHDGAAKYLLDVAFAGRDRLSLGSYDPSFASAWQQVGSELAGWLALVAAGALLAGAGGAAAIRAWELRVRTPAGSGVAAGPGSRDCGIARDID